MQIPHHPTDATASTPAQSLDTRSLSAIWHPCTQMARAQDIRPIPMVRGMGPWLFDDSDRPYFDANSSWWVNLFGHADAKIHAAIKRQLDLLPHVMLAGCTHEPAVRLAERLSAHTGGALGHVFFASDGASAVEIALKQSFHSWKNLGQAQKQEFVCLKNSYHGETIGALSVTDVALFRDAYDPMLMRSHVVESPDSRLGNEDSALAALRGLFENRGHHIAAFILEPLVQCAAGMVMHSPAYLRAVRSLTREFDIHLIADEIAVGCGRTGTFLAWEQVDTEQWPDFVTLSKGITGGTLPLSLVLTTDAVYRAFWSEDVTRGFLHSHSYTGNALACAAANAVLDRFDSGQVDANRSQSICLAEAFASFSENPRITHMRQRGMILAFDIADPGDRFSERFHMAARQHGLLIRPIGATVYLMPPYVIDQQTAAYLAGAVRATLQEVLNDAA
ncbi:adenosylmethionine--8-amino-7-oxononanoate transaminase [Leptothrix sp. BB-4]